MSKCKYVSWICMFDYKRLIVSVWLDELEILIQCDMHHLSVAMEWTTRWCRYEKKRKKREEQMKDTDKSVFFFFRMMQFCKIPCTCHPNELLSLSVVWLITLPLTRTTATTLAFWFSIMLIEEQSYWGWSACLFHQDKQTESQKKTQRPDNCW